MLAAHREPLGTPADMLAGPRGHCDTHARQCQHVLHTGGAHPQPVWQSSHWEGWAIKAKASIVAGFAAALVGRRATRQQARWLCSWRWGGHSKSQSSGSRWPRTRRRIATDTPEDFAPIAEYEALKNNAVASWGLLEEEDFSPRILAAGALGTVAGVGFFSVLFPFTSPSTGELSLENIGVNVLYGFGCGLFVVFVILFYILVQFDTVNKGLIRKRYLVEGRRGYSSGDGGAYAYAERKSEADVRRDRLLASVITTPTVSRMRTYAGGTLAALVLAFAGGTIIGGEIQELIEEEVEEEEEAMAANWYDPNRERRKLIARAGYNASAAGFGA